MTEDEIIRFAAALPDVTVVTASAATGAPEVAWGDSFFHVGEDRQFPFATLVVKDYPGWDEFSRLDRAGVFRVNVNVGKERFAALLGYPPSAFAARSGEYDYAALDTLLPHPAYGQQAWVSVLNPDSTAALVRTLLTAAHARVAAR